MQLTCARCTLVAGVERWRHLPKHGWPIEHRHAPQMSMDGMRVKSETSVLMELFYPPRIIKKSLQKMTMTNQKHMPQWDSTPKDKIVKFNTSTSHFWT